MCLSEDRITAAHQAYQKELLDAGLLIATGVPGLYGRSGVFENVIEGFDRYVTRMGADRSPEVMRFPPLLNRQHYLCTDHIDNFPQLMGSVHSFAGKERDHFRMLETRKKGGEWTMYLAPTDLMMTPATCYPLYPTATGQLPADGRTVDMLSYVFRHEPSVDPARMQAFRMHEYVRLGTPEQALEHRRFWLERSEQMLRAVGLDVQVVPANDPFFGRGGRMMAATQMEQELKFELVATVATPEKPTAIASCNYHLDHFGQAFAIRTADGNIAHSACVGFGLERIALALFRVHGFEPRRWPASVRQVLES
jgi:seryl-tRNA synthetase